MPPETFTQLLLPQNRRLRHFEALSLRNLSFVRPKGRTADDAAVNNASPHKLEALGESPKLHHALSTESLRPKARRRSSTLAQQDSPLSEQTQLMAMYDSMMADAFFSLHCEGEEEPVYVSETQPRKTNFDFRPFSLSHQGGAVRRSPLVTVRLWTKRPVGTKEWFLHLEETVDLRYLKFMGTLYGQRHPANSLIFHLVDGVYSIDLPNRPSKPKAIPALPTSSYNALMKLANLQDSLQDALQTREDVCNQAGDIIEARPVNEAPMAEQRAELALKYLYQQRRTVKTVHKRRDELRESIRLRREAIAAGREAQAKAETDVVNAREKLEQSTASLAKTKEDIRGQRRRICSDLADIFPITQDPSGEALAFRICGIPLPNTTPDSAVTGDNDALSAALGLVALLVHNLQCYLSIHLPYTITPQGSRSTVRDDISILANTPRYVPASASDPDGPRVPNPAREFPLFLPRGGSAAGRFRFDYAWFLLNKDIEIVCSALGLRVVDIRHTLPNVKYLLYVCSAGSDEVPQRKRGGVRGLWAGRLKGRIPAVEAGQEQQADGGSRRGSTDSDAVAQRRDDLQRALPFDADEMKVTLRTKGFSQNMGK